VPNGSTPRDHPVSIAWARLPAEEEVGLRVQQCVMGHGSIGSVCASVAMAALIGCQVTRALAPGAHPPTHPRPGPPRMPRPAGKWVPRTRRIAAIPPDIRKRPEDRARAEALFDGRLSVDEPSPAPLATIPSARSPTPRPTSIGGGAGSHRPAQLADGAERALQQSQFWTAGETLEIRRRSHRESVEMGPADLEAAVASLPPRVPARHFRGCSAAPEWPGSGARAASL